MQHVTENQDTQTEPTQRSIGRPVSGKAKTNAERQRNYRQRKFQKHGQLNLNLWITTEAITSLERLARHHKQTPADYISELLVELDHKQRLALHNDPKAYEFYIFGNR